MSGGITWTTIEDKYLRKHYPITDAGEIGKALGRTRSSVRSRAKKMQLNKSIDPRIFWTAARKRELAKMYPNTRNVDIADHFGVTEGSVSAAGFKFKLRKTAAFLQVCSEKGYFQPGHPPMNKGKKLADYCKPESIERMRATQFKKGQRPHNTRSDHEISIRADKRGVQYRFIRVGLGTWIPLLRYNWELLHGPIAPGMNLIHADGDSLNDAVENGVLLSNADLMKKNTYHNYGKDIASVIQLRGALTRQINKATKKLQNEK
jgi:hypothetical protein